MMILFACKHSSTASKWDLDTTDAGPGSKIRHRIEKGHTDASGTSGVRGYGDVDLPHRG